MAPLGGQLVLFGEEGDDSTYPWDTWAWNGTSWTRLDVTGGSSGPSAFDGTAMAPVNGELVLFANSDTWTWNGTSWTQRDVTGPSGRYGTVMATP